MWWGGPCGLPPSLTRPWQRQSRRSRGASSSRYLKSSFANEDHLNSYLDPNRGGQRYVEFHNMREGLYGIVASLMMGDAEWARQTGDLMLATLASITDDSGRWSIELARERGMADRCEGVGCPTRRA